MRSVDSLEAINIPPKYKSHLNNYMRNISALPFVNRVILFGGCAREDVKKYSDIDLFITTNRSITEDEETYITYYCMPEYSKDTVPTDIIVQTEKDFNKYVGDRGMVQSQVFNEGVDISGLLRERTRD